jgi:hypothetical protein
MADEEKIACRTPSEGRDGVTHIPLWKYQVLRRAILHAVGAAGPDGLPFSQLTSALRARLAAQDLARMGSLGWHATTVKLNMEVEGELVRMPGKGPQRLGLGTSAP